MATNDNKPIRQRGVGRILLEFLGSMNLAITLLVAIAIASVIGTVLKQNQDYTGYLGKFGPFWFEVFEKLGLYDIYGTTWFWAILGFLLVSTSVCIYRNAPSMLRDVRHFRLNVQEKSLRNFHNVHEWETTESREAVLEKVVGYLKMEGYRSRLKDHGDHLILAAKKGTFSRLGYILTHLSIVIICLGAALDANIGLRLQLMTGQKAIETRDMPANQVPAKSFLGVDNPEFRGSVYISEGGSAGIVFLSIKDGYLVQQLPFTVELKDFRIEHYLTGQPKSFESDLVIVDPDRKEPLKATISVNHPLVYKGYAIFQADFRDGGSQLKLRAWGINDGHSNDLQGTVGQDYKLTTPTGSYTLELNDFRMYNIDQAPEGNPAGDKKINFGPSYSYKLRDAEGQAREYNTYMAPIIFDGRPFFLTGVRNEVGGPMRYLHIPADPDYKIDRFMKFRAALADQKRVRHIVETQMMNVAGRIGVDAPTQRKATDSILNGVQRFVNGGYDALTEGIDNASPERKKHVQAVLNVLVSVFKAVYLDVLKHEGVDVSKPISDSDIQFFNDSLDAMSAIQRYGSPVFLQMVDFKQVQASGLQISKKPWTNLVWLGCLMLVLGVFFMFYIHHKRLWFWMRETDGRMQILFAGSGDRDLRGFKADFDRLAQGMDKLFKPGS